MTAITSLWIEQLRQALARRAPATLADETAQRAAVAVVVAAGRDPALLLVKRRERTGDPWSGHVAMPGGFSVPGEPASDTAIRETLEETGLDISGTGERLGYLDDVYPRSIHLPKVIVTPTVFVVPQLFPVAASREVERAVWVPIAELRDPANRDQIELERGGVLVRFPCINVLGLTIWGLTERVLSQFLSIAD